MSDSELTQIIPIPYATTNTSFKRFVVFVDASYFGHAFTLCVHLLLALLSLAGAYPKYRHYFEANQKHSKLFNHKSEDANGKSSGYFQLFLLPIFFFCFLLFSFFFGLILFPHSVEPPLTNAVSLLMKQIVNRESWYWLLGAAVVSLANGFFIQQVRYASLNVFVLICFIGFVWFICCCCC
jgi:hypothetical protein